MIRKALVMIGLLLLLPASLSLAAEGSGFSATISAVDPPSGARLAAYEKLYLRIDYTSPVQVRFQLVPLRNGQELEYGAMRSSTTLRPSGQEEALAWISFSNETHVDEVRFIVIDADWHKIDQFDVHVNNVWTATPAEVKREPAAWVTALEKKYRLRQEMVFDPVPQKQEIVYDTFFYFSVLTIPFYLIFQFQFLRIWRGRWREMAAIPIISISPMVIMSLLGMGMALRLWIIFIFRGMSLALLYLLALWFAKHMSEKKHQE